MISLEQEFGSSVPTLEHELVISTTACAPGGNIPTKYTCDGENISPPLEIGNIPRGTKTLAVIMEDPDAPVRPWVHWVAWNIPPVAQLEENHIGGTTGINDFRKHGYIGPCPPQGVHRYYIRVFALDTALHLSKGNTGKAELEKAIRSHVLASGELMCCYRRKKA
ncbi:MAG TPA: YbhB/YbcL family Raf kinase inhibitor-like protein [Chitinophagaceae bacterium]